MPMNSMVEGYKLSPQQLQFQKKYKILKIMQGLLEGETLKQQEKTRTLRSAWDELSSEFQNLNFQLPTNPLMEFEGMEEGPPEPSIDERWKIEY